MNTPVIATSTWLKERMQKLADRPPLSLERALEIWKAQAVAAHELDSYNCYSGYKKRDLPKMIK